MILILAVAAAQQSLPLHPPRPAPAETRTPIGTRLPQPMPEETLETQQRAVEVLQKFAGCVVDSEPLRAEAAVDLPLGTPGNVRLAAFRRLDDRMSFCLGKLNGDRMNAGMSAFVGSFAGQLYRRKWATLPALGRSEVPPADESGERAVRTTLSFADCLIDRAPAAADALVRSNARSPEEATALAQLAPRYGSCLNAGTTLAASRLALRDALSGQLYRRALASGAPAAPFTR
ncbi:MAG TPA: hypothetical protein VGC56_08980 [Allosphingosinicella sp.]